MRRTLLLSTSCVLFAMGSGIANADCGEEISSFTQELQSSIASAHAGGGASASPASTGTGGQSAEVAKDGSLAPLQSDEASAAATGSGGTTGATGDTAGASAPAQADEGEVAKDGSTMPLGEDQGEGAATTAMSGQDAQAQQEGGQTAAQQADQGGDTVETGAAVATGMGTGSDEGGETTVTSAETQRESVVGALDRARAANVRGDEEACMAALEEAKSLHAQM